MRSSADFGAERQLLAELPETRPNLTTGQPTSATADSEEVTMMNCVPVAERRSQIYDFGETVR
jgi:hypothetical protein